ncbi:MAG: molybdopterin synthase sulfur carrier subunit [Acidimicrobiaceae bacterium]|jgi:molybdopterin synthase sulfur carrier subunit|nr:molybdopterin synthase sulfur carrier subunit [Acidimicrobiaceae bacterium]|tara:strand:- start:35410 stop:35733 length:324 start_codon:yes stop_codon:yes gene_type:complete
MAVTIRIPTTFRELTKSHSTLSSNGANLRELLDQLRPEYPDFVNRVLDEDGNLQRFVNIFLDDEDVRFLGGLDTQLEEGQTLSIVPAVAGGSLLRKADKRGKFRSNK